MAGSARRGLRAEPPARIGRYEIIRQIGAGGMARVYLGVQRGPFAAAPKLVVVKQLRPEAAGDEHFLDMFVNEARITLRLSHPNVVHTYEVVAEPPDFYLAMEFLDGQSLMHILARLGRAEMPLEEHVWILSQVLLGLSYAHGLKDFDGKPLSVVHRDVSPSNILVCYSGEVKLLDFGIAKANGTLADTRQGVVKGKLGYVSPEQCLGLPADARSDIYAVGVMLWEAMARRRLSEAETWPAKMQARLQDSEPPIESIWPAAPPVLAAATRRALSRDPDKRYSTAQEFQRDLERFLSSVSRQVGAETVSALLKPHFELERAEIRQSIEAHLGRRQSGQSGPRLTPITARPVAANDDAYSDVVTTHLPGEDEDRDTSPVPVDDGLLLATRLDIPIAAANKQPLPRVEVPIATSTEIDSVPPLRPRRRWGWIGGGVALTALAIGGVIVSKQEDARNEDAEPASRALMDPGQTARTSNGEPSNLGESKIAIRIEVEPEDAEVSLDGKRLDANPFSTVVPKDGAAHELVVTADGYRDERRTIRFERDVDVMLSLTPTKESRTKRVARWKSARASATPSPVPEAVSAPAREPAPPPPPQRERVDPGADLRPLSPSRVKRTIDEKDPYAQ